MGSDDYDNSLFLLEVGIIGGTGLDDMDVLEGRQEIYLPTPFGDPSDALISGRIGGVDCVLLARHGRKDAIYPTNVNYRANIYALRKVGCTHVLAFTACGSLEERFRPGQIAVLDQFIDRTTKRHQTFYDGTCDEFRGLCNIPMADQFHDDTRQVLLSSLKELGIDHHDYGTMLTIEGPRFSTRAESNMFRRWGADLINMTTVPEVVLAKEVGLCYASSALITDYDCWKSGEEPVTAEKVMEVVRENAEKAKRLLLHTIPKLAQMDWTDIIKTQQG